MSKDKSMKLRRSRNVIINVLLIILIFIYGFIFFRVYYVQTSQVKDYVAYSYTKESLKPIGKNVSEESVIAIVKKDEEAKKATAVVLQQNNSYVIPTLIYHKTPPDFEQQLIALRDKGYTTIFMNELNDIVRGSLKAPAKPVAITFDDGFTDQLNAFNLLKKYNMKATFYIITGGELSDWCIGAEKKNYSCGDAYMNWSQIKSLLDSGLIEIGAHTINHLSLPNQIPNVQHGEIFMSKSKIEAKMGVKINSFAYPYGRYNGQLISLVQQAGYTNATGTEDGVTMSLGNIYNIPRIRTTLKLP